MGLRLPFTKLAHRLFKKHMARLAVARSIYWSFVTRGRIILSQDSKIISNPKSFTFATCDSELVMGFYYHSPLSSTVIHCYDGGRITIEGSVALHKGVYVTIFERGKLSIGDGTYVNEGTRIYCRDEIVIGKRCAIAWGVQILDTDEHHFLSREGNLHTSHLPINIGNHVWIGNNAIILKGVAIGEGAVVAAGAIVTHNVQPNTLVGGAPARSMRTNINWH